MSKYAHYAIRYNNLLKLNMQFQPSIPNRINEKMLSWPTFSKIRKTCAPFLHLCLRKTRKLRFQNVFCPYKNQRRNFKRHFGKLRFRDELVWTEGLTIEIKLRFPLDFLYIYLIFV